MRKLVVGDIHGGLRALKEVLGAVDFSNKNFFIFLGDYVDGWSEAAETIDFLLRFKKENRCLFLRGNHDDLCLQWLRDGMDNPLWLQSGGLATQQSYKGVNGQTRQEHIAFLESLEDYYLDKDHRLYLHAGFTSHRGVEQEYFSKTFYWDRTLWETAVSLNPNLLPEDERYPQRLKQYSEIFIGHTPVTRIGKQVPTRAANVWNIDTGAAFKGPLSIMDAESKQFWQSRPVYTYYPREKGRNG
ncbi:metallophosphoesterase [Robiginitalea sp. IMCC44478]|uniref:metallophosphoesterase n=1 Tax=Robiginitalea sp. IMCC44478 TaxID=3459122 RepID=UPI0040426D96